MANDAQKITEAVREHYGAIAEGVLKGQTSGCCGPSASDCCGGSAVIPVDQISQGLYAVDELQGLPLKAALTDAEYRQGLAAGFADIDLEITHRHSLDELDLPLPSIVANYDSNLAEEVVGRFASTFVRARKPA